MKKHLLLVILTCLSVNFAICQNISTAISGLSGPKGIAFDASGNLFIADETGGAIKKFSTTGQLTTLVSATQPKDVAVDAAGNVYFLEWATPKTLKKYTISTGITTTIANSNGTLIVNADGLAVDGSGNCYVIGNGQKGVQRITTSGTAAIISGTGSYTARCVAVDASGNVYFEEKFIVYKIPSTGGTATIVAGTGEEAFDGDGDLATKAALEDPTAIAFDASGNIYIADSWRIRKITIATGIISSIAGNGAWGNTGDGGPALSASLVLSDGVAIDKSGDVFFSQSKSIRKISSKVTSVNESFENLNIEVFPIPTTGILNISLPEDNNFSEIVLMDNTGKITKTYQLVSGLNTFNLEDLQSGLYHCVIRKNGEIFASKRIIID